MLVQDGLAVAGAEEPGIVVAVREFRSRRQCTEKWRSSQLLRAYPACGQLVGTHANDLRHPRTVSLLAHNILVQELPGHRQIAMANALRAQSKPWHKKVGSLGRWPSTSCNWFVLPGRLACSARFPVHPEME